ncbi:MAG: transcription antitermination factor NusB [Bacteroidetes bacterium]|nr:transcription antitermination factor NusB [Bacteroidota bacterium]
MQAIYAFQQDGPENINTGEKQLITSLDKLYELFIHQLSFLIELSDFARRRMEENKLKYLPTEEDLNPNMRFIENRFLSQLSNNRDYKKKVDQYKINWVDEEEMLRKCYNQMREHPDYIAYMSKDTVTYPDEKNIIEEIFIKIIAPLELLRSYYEEKSIYWSDDFDTSVMMVVKTIKGFRENWDEYTTLPTLLKDQNDAGGSEDMTFVKQLYRKTLLHSEDYNKVISQHAENWDIERIALMDTILIKMAISEFVDFTSIPVKVTLNEYIELSKHYSTPKSKVFINGILDKLIAEYRENGKISKTGRGLME